MVSWGGCYINVELEVDVILMLNGERHVGEIHNLCRYCHDI